MSLDASVIFDFGNPETLLVTRSIGPQVNNNGVLAPGATRQFETTVSIQPMKGLEILKFPEADRLKQAYKIYSVDELKVIDEVNKLLADRVEYHGTIYEIVSVERWVDAGNGPEFIYYKSIATRIDR